MKHHEAFTALTGDFTEETLKLFQGSKGYMQWEANNQRLVCWVCNGYIWVNDGYKNVSIFFFIHRRTVSKIPIASDTYIGVSLSIMRNHANQINNYKSHIVSPQYI